MSTESKPKFKGIPVFINGADYIVPSLSLEQYEEHCQQLSEPVTDTSREGLVEQFRKLTPIIGIALRRNYPSVTDADLRVWLDLITFGEAYLAVQGASGMTPVKPGE